MCLLDEVFVSEVRLKYSVAARMCNLKTIKLVPFIKSTVCVDCGFSFISGVVLNFC